MNPRLAAMAALCREVAIPASVFMWLATFGSGAAPMVERLVPSLAADAVSIKTDLFTVITLQGLPCGEVVSVTTKAENDHMASCKDGNRYHIYLNPQGRVVVEKR